MVVVANRGHGLAILLMLYFGLLLRPLGDEQALLQQAVIVARLGDQLHVLLVACGQAPFHTTILWWWEEEHEIHDCKEHYKTPLITCVIAYVTFTQRSLARIFVYNTESLPID